MSEPWSYQLRVYLNDALAETVRARRELDDLEPLRRVLSRHDATLVSQLQAFDDYVAEAEREGVERFPLYRWTKATVGDPAMRAKHLGVFAIRVSGQEVYAKAAADALEADLCPLVGAGGVNRLSRHDTNPATNIPVPPEYRS